MELILTLTTWDLSREVLCENSLQASIVKYLVLSVLTTNKHRKHLNHSPGDVSKSTKEEFGFLVSVAFNYKKTVIFRVQLV